MSPMATKKDYYEVLGVAKGAAPEDVKRAYRKAAAANHPDRNPGDDAAIERFKEAAEAYDVLGDEQKRALYDRYGHEAFARAGARQPGFNDVGDVFSAFGDLFEGFFGNTGSRAGGGQRASRGESLKCSIQLDLREAAFGVTRSVEIERDELCSTCDSSGAKAGSSAERCSYCAGRGQIVQAQGFFRVQTTCPACRGAGEVIRDKCPKCSGSGREAKVARIEVKVPPGVDNGMQLCVRGEGEPGDRGGPRGDLYCDIHVADHPLFKRQGHDLVCAVPLSYPQAALGTELEIPLLDGRHQLTISAGTQPGEIIRLRGKGMPDPHSRRKGDLLIQIHMEVPKKLTQRQEELLRELSELERTNVSAHQKSFLEKIKDYFASGESVGKE